MLYLIDEAKKPEPKLHELLVKYFALNRMDIVQREGNYPPPPGASEILGVEVSGIVAEVGSDVTRYKPGDEVFGLMGGGGYAEYAILHEDLALPLGNLSFEVAASIPEVWCTAYQAIHYIGQIKPGDDVLIHAGASGVGSVAIKLAKKAGANRIFTTSSCAEKLDFCRGLGATHLINYKQEKFVDVVRQATNGRGVDVIVDFIAAGYFEDNISSLAIDGRMSMQALLGGAKTEVNLAPIVFKRLKIEGSALRSRSIEYQRDLLQLLRREIIPGIESGKLTHCVDKVFSWKDIAEAHRYMEQNKNMGKIVVRVD
ncbi:hypothetical protein EV182_005168 [Spiromyces aspiralis]|uniref:Uncharacterized protein n=1 Tax=Spiromyces aspiralis TaxID=68401 RepID=A0ACC1HAE6_9FUNG|nr:hypothetical protein EV182_005168 [Spiromyces aspiralis]